MRDPKQTGQREGGKRMLNSEGTTKGCRQRSGQKEFRQPSESLGQVQRAGELLGRVKARFLERTVTGPGRSCGRAYRAWNSMVRCSSRPGELLNVSEQGSAVAPGMRSSSQTAPAQIILQGPAPGSPLPGPPPGFLSPKFPLSWLLCALPHCPTSWLPMQFHAVL